MSGKVIDQPAKLDVYPHQSEVETKLEAWMQWKSGDGVKGQVRTIAFTHEEAQRREESGARFRLPMVVADAEHTDRAVKLMMREDMKGWLALRCFHLGDEWGRSDNRSIAKRAKLHHADVTSVLKRAHDNFMHYRSQTDLGFVR